MHTAWLAEVFPIIDATNGSTDVKRLNGGLARIETDGCGSANAGSA